MCPHLQPYVLAPATVSELGVVVLKQEREQGWSLVSESERTLKPSGQLEATLVQASLLYVYST